MTIPVIEVKVLFKTYLLHQLKLQRSPVNSEAPFKPSISLWLLYHSLSGQGFQACVFSSFVCSAGGHEWEVGAWTKADHGSIGGDKQA